MFHRGLQLQGQGLVFHHQFQLHIDQATDLGLQRFALHHGPTGSDVDHFDRVPPRSTCRFHTGGPCGFGAQGLAHRARLHIGRVRQHGVGTGLLRNLQNLGQKRVFIAAREAAHHADIAR